MAAQSCRDCLLCADWLVHCQILTRDQRAAQPTATIHDLNHALRDGVLICLLINRLRPKTIDPKDFSQRPQMSQFLCIKNIKVFLQACRNYFAMSESDLFKPHDLFEGTGMQKVIASLSVLSQTSVARLAKFEPFMLVNDDSSSSAYINMSSIDDGYDFSDEDEYYAVFLDQQNEDDDIYGDLVALKHGRMADTSGRQPPHVTDSSAPKSHHDLCVNELVTTEENYVKCLEMITQTFMIPLKAVIPQKLFDKIFANVERLYEVHSQFSTNLRMATTHESVHTIADCFIMNKEKFLVYGEYCSNLLQAQDLLDNVCNTTPAVQSLVTSLQDEASKGRSSFKLRDLLTVPMQRVLKYHLLLKELIKHTDDNDPEKRSLQKALEETQDLSLFVNEVKRDNEMIHSLNMVQKSILNLPLPSDMSLKDYGRLLYDGEIKVKYEKISAQRHVFVLDQLVIICKTKGDAAYEYCASFSPGTCDIEDALVKDWNNVWFSVSDTPKQTFMFGAKKEDVRKKWLDAIRMAKNNTLPPNAESPSHSFHMATFLEPTICDVCRKLLRGTYFQGYRCTKTMMSVHKECLAKARDMDGPPIVPPKAKLQNSHVGRSHSSIVRTSPKPAVTKDTIAKYRAVANYSGIPPPPGHRPVLTFEKGSVIDVYRDDGVFCEGCLNGQEGFFPKNCVQRRPSYEQVAVAPYSGGMTLAAPTTNVLVDDVIESYPWFVGNMDRTEAVNSLQHLPDNIFLVRGNDRESRYALTLKYNGATKHIKIQPSDKGGYYLASCHEFPTISSLIDYYQKNTLEKIFPEVKTCLQTPYKDAIKRPRAPVIGYCIAQYDYEATQPNQLSLKESDRIGIISKAGEATGWWKGNNNGKVGYFPYAYVSELDN